MRMSMRGLQTASPRARSAYAASSALRVASGVRTRWTTALSIRRMVQILLEMTRHEATAFGSRLRRARDHRLLEEYGHEHHHRIRLHHQRARRLCRVGVEVLVHAVHLHDRHFARRSVVADAVVEHVAL